MQDQKITSVSVVIDTYNQENFIRKALDSVLNQSGIENIDMQIIVIDDGSVDSTPDILRSYGDKITPVIKENEGQGAAFNLGVSMSSGDIICFLDGDDWWHEDKVRCVIDALDNAPGSVAVGHGIVIEDEVVGGATPKKPIHTLNLHFDGLEQVRVYHKHKSFLGTSRLSIRRSIAEEIVPIPKRLIFEADEYFFAVLPAIGNVIILDRCLTHYRIHGNNLYQDSMQKMHLSQKDVRRLTMRADIFACLSETLPPKLKQYVSDDIAAFVTESCDVAAGRIAGALGGISRAESIKFEKAETVFRAKINQKNPRVMSRVRLVLAAVMPAKTYHKIRAVYSGLRR